MSDLLGFLDSLSEDDADAFLDSLSPDEIALLADEIPPSEHELAAARAEAADGLAWIRRYLPELAPLEPGPHHRELASCLSPDGPTGLREVVAAPRGSGKSTIALTGLPILVAVRQSHRFVVVIRNTVEDAKPVVRGIRDTIESRPDLVARYPWLRPINREAGELHLAGGTIILARGAGSSIRGLNRPTATGGMIRPSLVLADDVETDETARSKLQTGRLQEWVLGTVGQLGGPPGHDATPPLDVLLIGTTIETDALVSRMLDGRGPFASWRRMRFPAEAKVIKAEDVRGSDGVGLIEGERVCVDTRGVPVPIPVPPDAAEGDRVALWPHGQPLAYLDSLLDRNAQSFVGSVIYAREYLLRPVSRTDVLLRPEFTVWTRGLTERFLARELPGLDRVALGVDPSLGKRESSDYSALVVTGLYAPEGKRDDGSPWPSRIAVPYAERRRCSPAELIAWIESVAELFGARVAFEAVGGFGWGADELRRRRSVSIRGVDTGGADKRTRAVPLSVWQEAGRLELDESLVGTDVDDEIHSFTGTGAEPHDDVVDALVIAAGYTTSAWRRS